MATSIVHQYIICVDVDLYLVPGILCLYVCVFIQCVCSVCTVGVLSVRVCVCVVCACSSSVHV